MMRSLWTAASGMNSQQLNVDTISNNLSNVNTTGYKKERMEFKSLLYQTMQRADQDPANTVSRPVNLQIGLGVRPIATARFFDQGSVIATSSNMDFAIEGKGFFSIQRAEGDIAYTRDGSFKISVNGDGELALVTSEGYPVLNSEDEPITFPAETKIYSILVDRAGSFTYTNDEGEFEDMGIQLDVVQFSNVQGLEAVGGNFYKVTSASGEPIKESDGEVNELSNIIQNYLERSNVAVADEMVDLIVAQRAYELNSKVIQSSDEMLQTANGLKR